MTAPFPYRGASEPGEPLPDARAQAVADRIETLGFAVQPWQRAVLGAVFARGYVAPLTVLPRRSASHP